MVIGRPVHNTDDVYDASAFRMALVERVRVEYFVAHGV